MGLEDLQRRVDIDRLTLKERIIGPAGLNEEQKKEFELAKYWLDQADKYARRKDKSLAERCICLAQDHEPKTGVSFKKRIEKIRSYYTT